MDERLWCTDRERDIVHGEDLTAVWKTLVVMFYTEIVWERVANPEAWSVEL